VDETPLPVIHIACAANEKYVGYCAAMLHSAFAKAGGARLEIHFLHPEDLPEASLRRLRDMVEGFGGRFSPAAIDENALAALPRTWYFPRIIWYRILLPELRPGLDRVLYLDCDTLIMDSLLELWQTDLEQFYVAAVQNLIEPRFATRHHSMGIPPGQVYFNSGVLLLNLKLMREQGCVERIYEYAARYGSRSVWPDQDALNHVLGPKCHLLHPRWNCQNSFFFWPQARDVFGEKALAEATRAPAILHFEGPPETKPWHYLNNHPFRAKYWQHFRSTPFPAPPPEGRTARNMLRRYLPGLHDSGTLLHRKLRRWIRR
jgi:lipopolysaccharide biosynthesis glycosyltransferase